MNYKDYLIVANYVKENVSPKGMMDTDEIASDLYVGAKNDDDLADALLHIGIESVTAWFRTDIKKSIGRIISNTLYDATEAAEFDANVESNIRTVFYKKQPYHKESFQKDGDD